MTILIVDDNEQNLYQLQVLLGAYGYKVTSASNGDAALTAARRDPPTLVISDILMPVMDGFTLCREWMNDERLRSIPFIFYTATYTDERDREFALSLGAERFLVKPEEPEILMGIVHEVIQNIGHSTPPATVLAVAAPTQEETGYLKQYNAVLIRKMEAKMLQLERANRELEEEIARREQAEVRIRQLNRTYSVLSNINQTIVREKDPQAMLGAACKVAVEKGLFQMVWVGLLDSHRNRVDVAASAGLTGDYLDKIDSIPGDAPQGQGPIAEALRSGSHVVCNDIEYDPRMIFRRESALRLGFRAFAAFPIKVENDNIGVFALYSDRKDAFNTEELRLLDELAMDISFALEAGRREMERQKAEKELRWRTAFFEAQVESAIDGILVVDSQGRKILQNSRLIELCKIPPHIAEDKDDSRQVRFVASRTKYPERFAGEIARLYSQPEEVSRDELEFLDGTVLDQYSSPVRDKLGNYYGRIWTFRDITESKRAEAEMAYLAAIVESADDAIISMDLQGIITSWNAGAEKVFGYLAIEIIGQPVTQLIPTDLHNKQVTILETIRRGGNLRNFETVRLCKDGKPIDVSLTISPIKDIEGRVIGASKIVKDITERKRTEQSHARLAKAVEQAGESIVITDTEGTILYANPAFEKSSGYTCEEALGMNSNMLKSGKHNAEFYQKMWDALSRGEIWCGHFVNRRKNGIFYEEDATISPVRDATGRVINYVAVKRDVTQEVEMRAQLQQSQKLKSIGQLAGGVAHDFNNTLAIISLQIGLLGGARNLSPDQTELLAEMEGAVKNGADLTRQLLIFSQRQILQLGDVDLNDSVTNLSKMLQRILGEDIRTEFKCALEPLFVHADAGMIDQILMNLTVNARHAMPEGGELIIETCAVEFDEFTAKQSPEFRPGLFACLSVSDTGCGIAPENIERIFEPFFTTKEVGKGTGLGLATVFGIVKQHNGWINVYSEIGQGSTFRLYFPLLIGRDEKAFSRLTQSDVTGGNETILVVEDNPQLLALVQSVLSHLGYRVIKALTGAAALEIFQQKRNEISLLLTDLVLPGEMNGRELAQRLLEENPKLKVIYASGYSAEVAGKDLKLEENINFLSKPFKTYSLANTVRAMLDS